MKKFLLAVILSLTLNAAAVADDIEPLLGEWTSPDGLVRQRIARRFDGSLIETKMWFRGESGWRAVSVGSMYRRPGENVWRSTARTRDMDGIELFESTIEPRSAGSYRIVNVAYMQDGSRIENEEEWIFSGEDSYEYTIFKMEEGRRVPWMKGSWVRAK